MLVYVGSTLVGALAGACVWWAAATRHAGMETARLASAAGLARVGRFAALTSYNHASFEGGNIGEVTRTGPAAFKLELRSDNDDALPSYWRQWFYLKLDRVPTDQPVSIKLTGAGQWSYYVPFFSYDNRRWQQFRPSEVSKPSRYVLEMRRQFARPVIWLARYEPYTLTRLKAFLASLPPVPDLKVGELARSPLGRTVPLVTIGKGTRSRIVIHARTHPGEVGSSFLLEGLIKYLLSDAPLARRLRLDRVFTILPMLNVDGVVSGNNRVSPAGKNLEGKWYARAEEPLALDEHRTPSEVRSFHAELVRLLSAGPPVSMALNLHASAGEPDDNVFIFPHFGPEELGYTASEARLYQRQVAFIDLLRGVQGKAWFNQPPLNGTRAFLKKSVPESWWWRNFKDRVMALTIESTYGLAGGTGRWVQPRDMQHLGESLAKAIAAYHDVIEPSPMAH